MAKNDFSAVNIADQQFPNANAPVWTVPSDAVPNSDVVQLVPSGDAYPQPSAPNISDLPPSYFDISIVPDNAVLHYNEVVPYTEPSQAKVELQTEGVLTFDPLVDKNPDQLWLYFMTYLNQRPSLNMNVHGYHVEVGYSFSFRDANISFRFSITQLMNNTVQLMGTAIRVLSITRET